MPVLTLPTYPTSPSLFIERGLRDWSQVWLS